jgi:hypothetical protein
VFIMAEVIPVQGNDGFLGGGLGAGLLGGLFGGMLFGNGGWGWGGNRGNVGVGSAYDAGLLTGLSNQITHANDAAVQAQMSTLQQASSQNMFMGNLVNSTGDAIPAAINQGTISALHSAGDTQRQLCGINQNITQQGLEGQLNAQRLAAQGQVQFCQIGHAIFEEGCKNRELQRQIASENQAQQLADAKAQVAALQAQINLSQQLAASQAAQTQAIIAALKPAATAAAG